MRIEGSCHCRRVTYEAVVDPDTAMICHCTDCQTLMGSAFRAVVPAPAATSLHFARYNFVRLHKTLRTTPAMAAEIENRLWSLEELVERTSR